jgi:hypothetical protein
VICERGRIYNFKVYDTTPSLNVSRPENVSVREIRFSRDKHLGTREYVGPV